MIERPNHLRIDDLTSIGEELTEERLRLLSRAANKKQSGPGRRNGGASPSTSTMVIDGPTDSEWREADGDHD